MVRLAWIAFQEIDHAEPRNQFRRPGGVYRRAGDRGCLPDGRPLLHQTRRNTGRIRRTAAATAAGNTRRKILHPRVPKDHSIDLIKGVTGGAENISNLVANQFFDSIARRGQVLAWIDRKSTRLNSSHRCISYAVFCLKKKK